MNVSCVRVLEPNGYNLSYNIVAFNRDVKRGNLYVVQDQIGSAIGMVRSSVSGAG